MPATITILGTGHMGTALITGLIAHQYPAAKIQASDPSSEKLTQLQQQFGITVFSDNKTAVEKADVVILAVKPQIMPQITQELAPLLSVHKPLFISIAAGIPLQNLQAWLGGDIPIIRCMPNTPALVRAGATALYANSYTSPVQRDIAEAILGAVGITVWLEEEKQMDAVTALSGSGPAYFFLLMEAMQKIGEKLGLPAGTARLLTLQTALGASRLAMESDISPEQLRQQVTSPGGTTEAALKVLENENFHALITKALQAAQQRSEELAKQTESHS